MAEKSDTTALADLLLRTFLDACTKSLPQAGQAITQSAEGRESSADGARQRRQQLDEISKQMDAYLRSPSFLQALKIYIDGLILARRQAVQFSEEYAEKFNAAQAEPLTTWLSTMSDAQKIFQSRVEQVEQRIASIEWQVQESSDPP